MLSTLVSITEEYVTHPFLSTLNAVGGWILSHPSASLLSIAGTLTVTWAVKEARARPSNMPPGPTPLPFIGCRHLLDYSCIHKSWHEMSQTYGDVFTCYVMNTPIIVLSSYDAITEGLISDRYLTAGRPPAERFLQAMNEEVFMQDFSEPWKLAKKTGISGIRKYAQPHSGVEQYMIRGTEYLLERFANLKGKPMDLKPELIKVTANITSAFVFGVFYDDLDDPELAHLAQAQIDWYHTLNHYSPWNEVDPPWLVGLMFGKELDLFADSCYRLREHCKMIIKRMGNSWNRKHPTTLLEYFMATRDMEQMGGLDAFADTICLYTVDPSDTMAEIMESCLFYLAYFPEEQKKLQNLTDTVVGRGELVTDAHRNELGLAESFYQEVQRHMSFTSITFAHSFTRDTDFRGYHIPKEIFPEPDKFKPDRFIDEIGRFRKGKAVYTFSAGARGCPGGIHTRLEIFLILTNLVHRFHVAFPADQPRPPLQVQNKGFFKRLHHFQVTFTER